MKSMYASRSVPVLNTPVSNEAYVDDSSSQNESLQRKADMANGAVQRVVQRETGVVQRTGEADGKFMYVADLTNNPILHENALGNYSLKKNADVENDQFYKKLPYMEGCICFSDYKNGLQSPGFTGCMMMAFHFNLNEKNKINEVKRLFKGGVLPFYIDPQNSVDVSVKKYVAHVYCENGNNDTKEALFDAEQRNLITIEALFKPFLPEDGNIIFDSINNNENLSTYYPQHPEIMTLRGQLTQNESNQWFADVFTADNVIYDGVKDQYPDWGESEKIKHYNSYNLDFETLATKALLYASVLNEKIMAVYSLFEGNGPKNKKDVLNILSLLNYSAYVTLCRLAENNSDVIKLAEEKSKDNVVNRILDSFLTDDYKENQFSSISGALYGNVDDTCLLALLFKKLAFDFIQNVCNLYRNNNGDIDWKTLFSIDFSCYSKLVNIVFESKFVVERAIQLTENKHVQMILKKIIELKKTM